MKGTKFRFSSQGAAPMSDSLIVCQLPLFPESLLPPKRPENKLNLHSHWQHRDRLPSFVTDDPTVMRILDLLGPLHWEDFPERDLQRNWGQTTIPYTAFIAAELIK